MQKGVELGRGGAGVAADKGIEYGAGKRGGEEVGVFWWNGDYCIVVDGGCVGLKLDGELEWELEEEE